jgi:ribosomal protein S18 acetylase RimI-like enzyme
MPVRLRAVGDDELPEFVRSARDGYAQQLEQHAYASAADAREKADRDIAELLPDGRIPEGHHAYVVEDVSTGDAVGRLWFAERVRGDETVAWIYEISIDERARGQGLGREAMLLLEDEVRRLGLPAIALNVFGGNEPARSLYRSLGYRDVSVWMSKELA